MIGFRQIITCLMLPVGIYLCFGTNPIFIRSFAVLVLVNLLRQLYTLRTQRKCAGKVRKMIEWSPVSIGSRRIGYIKFDCPVLFCGNTYNSGREVHDVPAVRTDNLNHRDSLVAENHSSG